MNYEKLNYIILSEKEYNIFKKFESTFHIDIHRRDDGTLKEIWKSNIFNITWVRLLKSTSESSFHKIYCNNLKLKCYLKVEYPVSKRLFSIHFIDGNFDLIKQIAGFNKLIS